MKTRTTLLFFDFYTLSLLNYFAGDNSLNHENRVRRIRETYEKSVDELYDSIRHSLTYSVIREFRHFNEYGPAYPNDLSALSRKSRHEHRNRNLRRFLNNESNNIDISYNRISKIYEGFLLDGWDSNYGGKLWATATKFLLDEPNTTKRKELWVDRVLDLQHNSGHILNKTKFIDISERTKYPKYTVNQKGKRVKKINDYWSALDYRRYSKTLSELAEFSSPKVNRLVTANLNFIPELIQ